MGEAPRVDIGNENKCGITLGLLQVQKACHNVKQCYSCKSILVFVAGQWVTHQLPFYQAIVSITNQKTNIKSNPWGLAAHDALVPPRPVTHNASVHDVFMIKSNVIWTAQFFCIGPADVHCPPYKSNIDKQV